MSLGSRIAKRGKAAVIASLVSTPREPLLFLYPQWVRNSSTASPAAATRPSINASESNTANHNPSTNSKRTSLTTQKDGPKVSQRPSKPEILRYRPLAVSPDPPQFAKSPGSDALVGDIVFPTPPIEAPDPSSTLADIERRVSQILSTAYEREKSQISAHSIREEYQEWRRERTENWVPDWRLVLDRLLETTIYQGRWLDRQIQVVVPEDAAKELLTGLDNCIWDIGNSYGCSVGLGPGLGLKHGSGAFIVSGSKNAIARTLADIIRIAPGAKFMMTEILQLSLVESQPSAPETANEVKIRSVISTDRSKADPTLPEKIPKPCSWTQASFLKYVKALTSIELPNNLGTKQRQYWDQHLDMLRDLFKEPDEACRAAITRTACHEALRYFVKVNKIEDVRVLFVRMELMKIKLTPETFNIMLRGAAKQEDLHLFHFILHLMLRRGFSPNGETWNSFMMTLYHFKMKVYVASAMKHKGLLRHKSTMKAVCEQLVRPEIQLSLDAFQDQEAFTSHMDSRYGREWLTQSSANHILHELGSRGLISRCWDFLHFMDSRFIKIDNYSINTILQHCRQTKNLEGAIELLKQIPRSWDFQPDKETFRKLFDLAWHTHSHNVAKVVWKYACLQNMTNFDMRDLVRKSLLEAWTFNAAYRSWDSVSLGTLKRNPRSAKRRWEFSAGSVIIGGSLEGHPIRHIDRLVNSKDQDTPGILIKKDTREEREQRKQLKAKIITLRKPELMKEGSKILPIPLRRKPLLEDWIYEDFREHLRLVEKEFWLDLQFPRRPVTYIPEHSLVEMLSIALRRDHYWKRTRTRTDSIKELASDGGDSGGPKRLQALRIAKELPNSPNYKYKSLKSLVYGAEQIPVRVIHDGKEWRMYL
ncbi:uncharacterized protein PAC_09628 [Phialocephala subalpina]|uniref:Pentatricopeptide repeat domain-containing protein n=1 Tax=Phialocephala subalpina TaxID=576137 RepID=A0A1L7X3Y4_9HELO|nr:uncharacterized protein PAC_09628 [Phialocephala subalpina]